MSEIIMELSDSVKRQLCKMEYEIKLKKIDIEEEQKHSFEDLKEVPFIHKYRIDKHKNKLQRLTLELEDMYIELEYFKIYMGAKSS